MCQLTITPTLYQGRGALLLSEIWRGSWAACSVRGVPVSRNPQVFRALFALVRDHIIRDLRALTKVA
jgi:hypothetical protein